jgi:hypothetical protein
MGQVIGTVNVQVGQTQNPRVSSISYGIKSLKSLNDVSMADAADGDVLVYQANTNSFILEPVEAVVPYIDGGTF